eukprot:TRINITY_DN6332_c0_g1_i1.p1 TRINITY_DN6332_c0_g1~~TRINITY_DN6332_c0_g1_i1.p1  ORF type:complete len:198 (-),score=14.03 TRINITY_DN6332_c0_g1_i1:208-801(-)
MTDSGVVRRKVNAETSSAEASQSNTSVPSASKSSRLVFWLKCLIVVLPIIACGFYLRHRMNSASKGPASTVPPKPRLFRKEELWQYRGEDESLPIYLGFNGRVYDVSKGKEHYDKNGGYHFFAGRDATRAFFTGCFKEPCLLPDIDEYREKHAKDLVEWQGMYDTKYVYVGYLHKDDLKSTPEQLEAARKLEEESRF